jgi:hypothetical protein
LSGSWPEGKNLPGRRGAVYEFEDRGIILRRCCYLIKLEYGKSAEHIWKGFEATYTTEGKRLMYDSWLETKPVSMGL